LNKRKGRTKYAFKNHKRQGIDELKPKKHKRQSIGGQKPKTKAIEVNTMNTIVYKTSINKKIDK